MNLILAIGVGWAISLYILGASLIKRAENELRAEFIETLRVCRRQLRPIPFLLAGMLLVSLVLHPTGTWLMLAVGVIGAVADLLVQLHSYQFPRGFIRSYGTGAGLIGLGWMGLSISLGVANGFSL